nr:TetR family transcriptional regulator [uncultured Devosia sp.]
MEQPVKIRDVAKRAIRGQISSAALARFKSQGYQDTTVDQIAADVGMSTRTFFRYFPSKDDVLLEASYLFGDRFLTNLKSGLSSNDLWRALGDALEKSVEQCRLPGLDERDREVQALIRITPSLLARQLEAMEKVQIEAVALCLKESPQASKLTAGTVHAIVGSAFACYQASVHYAARQHKEIEVGSDLQTIVQSLRPRILDEEIPHEAATSF